MITPKEKFEEEDEGSTYHSDMFAMVGTIFLWMFWPSFNGALATGDQQHRVIINTVISLTASCVTTFVMSSIFRHDRKFDMVDIQNATLAGGVAVGSASDLFIGPWAALLIGVIAGTLSVVGYTRLQPYLQGNRIVHDTCGVNNLHGMPGILGGLAGAVSAAVAQDSDYGDVSTVWGARAAAGDNRSAGEQAGYQIAALVTTVVIASLGGVITGAFVKCIRSSLDAGHTHYFHDGDYWEGVCDLEGAPASLIRGWRHREGSERGPLEPERAHPDGSVQRPSAHAAG
jgi:ammonium transporter Rh